MRIRGFANKVMTTRISQPYRGIAISQFERFIKPFMVGDNYGEITRKKMFYVFRPLMAGIFALETGMIEPNLVKLCDYFDDKMVLELVDSHIREDKRGFSKSEIEKYVGKMQEYFMHIDFAAQESSQLFHDDGTADQKERHVFKEEIFFDANKLIRSMRLHGNEVF
jgi:predicted nucleotidyltransferase